MSTSDDNVFVTRFRRGLQVAPLNPALCVAGRTLTYEQADRLALRWAGGLVARAGGRPAAVAVLAGRGVEGYLGVLAAHYAGATVVPLQPDWPAARARQMLEAARAGAVLADAQGLAKLAETGLDLPVLTPDTGLCRSDDLDQPLPVTGDATAYVLFTSGSTGRPKGVPLPYSAFRHYFRLLDERYDFHAGDAFAQTMELNFDCAIFDLFCAWGAGAAVLPVPPSAYRDLARFAAERAISVWFSTPSSIAFLRRLGALRAGALPGLRWSFFAGEALLATDVADWQVAAPNTVVENLYGPTELTVTICSHRIDRGAVPDSSVNGVVPIGAVHDGHETLLLDAAGQPAVGEGELCVTGPQMTPGYLEPADDRDRFLEYGDRRWYRTGDRVRRIAGDVLAYLGRDDAQVQVKGRRVELAEIDAAVRAHPAVQDAVTVARDADGSTALTAFYTGTPIPPMELSAHLHRLLPPGVVPGDFQHLEVFPLNANRKIDRIALAGGPGAPSVRSLAPSQETIYEFAWSYSPEDPGASGVNVMSWTEWPVRIDAGLFQRAVDDVVARQDSLRMVMVDLGAAPTIRFVPDLPVTVGWWDLADEAEPSRIERLTAIGDGVWRREFDLRKGPLWTITVVRLASDRHAIGVCLCHLIADGWSVNLLLNELAQAYRHRVGAGPALPPLRTGFEQIAALQEPREDVRTARAEFWRSRLSPPADGFPFPPQAPPPGADLSERASVPVSFSRAATDGLAKLAARKRTTRFILLLACYKLWLAGWTGWERVVVGTTTHGRRLPGSEQVVGQFTTNLYLATEISPQDTLAEVARRVHQEMTGAMRHAASFTEIARAVNPDFDAVRPWPFLNLYDAWFQATAANGEMAGAASPENDGTSRAAPRGSRAAWAGHLSACPGEMRKWAKRGEPGFILDQTELTGNFVYCPAFYPAELVSEAAHGFSATIDAFLADPGQRVEDLPRWVDRSVAPTGLPTQPRDVEVVDDTQS
ncbi:hypothetical protein GCM10010172_65920 [Paractinoplanes ferrugineus]|uniref:Amino acid adenylation domain-containing protein n=1 Tax=Paractinoplanes ferrugineus TaxID=113564 RepID=A0A919MMH1_9ACTN|nr:AMP-binding protein [Actinoplanes ferrugineus]GIE13247.1 hypothetical protein Afe05nite_50870 [Actinoplanes ferrugineus]